MEVCKICLFLKEFRELSYCFFHGQAFKMGSFGYIYKAEGGHSVNWCHDISI